MQVGDWSWQGNNRRLQMVGNEAATNQWQPAGDKQGRGLSRTVPFSITRCRPILNSTNTGGELGPVSEHRAATPFHPPPAAIV